MQYFKTFKEPLAFVTLLSIFRRLYLKRIQVEYICACLSAIRCCASQYAQKLKPNKRNHFGEINHTLIIIQNTRLVA